jgi:penicillin-binding protein 1A
VASVWLGNDDNSPMRRVSGGGLPSEIWGRFMRQALQGQQPVALPGGLWRGQPVMDGTPVAGAPAQMPGRRPPAPIAEDNPVRAAPQERGLLERLFGG